MSFNELLAMDIGGGTQDILLWRAEQNLENAVKLVLPAPTQVAAARLARARREGRDVFLHGELMGGGAVHKAVDAHLAAGLRVYATPPAAATFADDPAKVAAMGIQAAESAPEGALALRLGDLNLAELAEACARFEVELPRQLALAVCDHGYSPGFSNRKFRFNMWRRFLEGGGLLAGLISQTPPPDMTRLEALSRQAPGCLLMDTAAAAAWGALEDPAVAAMAQDEGVCIVNLGNMHTVAFLVRGDKVLGNLRAPHPLPGHHKPAPARWSDFIQGDFGRGRGFCGARPWGGPSTRGATRGLPHAPVITGPQRRMAQGLGWKHRGAPRRCDAERLFRPFGRCPELGRWKPIPCQPPDI